MEWLPKLIDTFDSGVFSLRLAWAGYFGQRAVSAMKIGALGAAIVINPVVFGVCAVAAATYFLAEMAYRLCLLATRASPVIIRR
jgi:hypothetical protein